MNFPYQEFSTFRSLLIYFFATFALTISACSHQPSHKRHPKPTPSLSSPSSVEQHLLATVKQAESLPPGNPLLLSSLYSLATYYEDQKEYEKSAMQYQRVLDLKENQIGPNHPDLALILNRYAQVLHQANRHSEAQSVTARANAIMRKSSTNSSTQ
ncbi:MAG: tetratricopeptide repeat protein [Nitrospirales bacterium]|nr:tetratricopeptide repeat protein [Nitrospirales bacterium]